MNKLFAWDEINNELSERDPEDLWRCNAVGGWFARGAYNASPTRGDKPLDVVERGDDIVLVIRTPRHIGLETWAPSAEIAHQRFLICDDYREMNETEA